MKLSRSLLDLAALSLTLASTASAAPSTPSPDLTPDNTPHFQIDLSTVPTGLSARDTDTTIDHSLSSHNFFGNEEWAVAIRPGVGPVWIHSSRWKTLLEEPENTSVIESGAADANGTSTLEARQWYGYGYGYGYNSYYPYYGYGSGYQYYAKRDAAPDAAGDAPAAGTLAKRDTCPAQTGYNIGCNKVTDYANSASFYGYNGYTRNGWAPKMNVYSDTTCNSYLTSVIGDASCLTASVRIQGIITFNQQL
ncbi:uncharacterized protein DSM5745_00794 [Aspergillus mulundensis]|uniref:Uncharacterized protein n=1 Tax=Aspergillus mulundensis TaxID=1810919 RepID=A0A3D8T4I0_9EURO|nr:Uncharacterized protein DSM5745_00794 [Aspergillus mulundensis]RDW93472.1 Uncharacterized protein DSM5745_00794 [Aspergillus mulundensis]